MELGRRHKNCKQKETIIVEYSYESNETRARSKLAVRTSSHCKSIRSY